ncbi:MAG: MFS transporter, partial [Pseudomonadota bacterium]
MLIVVIGLVISVTMAAPVFWQMRQHPKGLHILFFAEMWERFSYYGMRSLLVFYMTQHFMFTREEGNLQYGTYTSLVYLLPLIGGYLADKYLGTRKAIAFGAILLVVGHGAMAIEGRSAQAVLNVGEVSYPLETRGRGDESEIILNVAGEACVVNPGAAADACAVLIEERETGAVDDAGAPETVRVYVFANMPEAANMPAEMSAEEWTAARAVEGRSPLILGIFFLALSLIVMGVGFLKSNISAIVGQLYAPGDPRRDPGFTLYYFGINIGAFWASILCGLLAANYGWWAGFGLAGLGMLLGYLVFVRGRFLFFTPGPSQLPDDVGRPPEPEKLRAPVAGSLSREHLIYIGGVLGVGFVWLMMQRNELVGALLSLSSILVLGYLAWLMVVKFTREERDRLILALILIAFSVVFWTLFEQAGSSLN